MPRRAIAAIAVAVLLVIGVLVVALTWPWGDGDGGTGRSGSTPSASPTPLGPSPTPTRTPSLAGWRPVLQDDFDTLDRSRWNVLDGTAHSNEESNLFADNVSTRDGVLRIQARRQQTTTRAGGTREFTSGYLDTTDRFELPPYFRFEVRARVPFAQGMWAAPGWMRPTDKSGGEIDTVETYGADRDRAQAEQTIHAEYGPEHQQSTHRIPFAQVGDPRGTGWHTYIVEKTPGRILMWVDGVRSSTWTSGNPTWFDSIYEAGKPWDLRLNLQVGAGEGAREDNHPDDSTSWDDPDSTSLRIDYVRVYAQRG